MYIFLSFVFVCPCSPSCVSVGCVGLRSFFGVRSSLPPVLKCSFTFTSLISASSSHNHPHPHPLPMIYATHFRSSLPTPGSPFIFVHSRSLRSTSLRLLIQPASRCWENPLRLHEYLTSGVHLHLARTSDSMVNPFRHEEEEEGSDMRN